MPKRTLLVPPLDGPVRLDRYLASSGVIASRSQVKASVDAGRVRIDGVVRKAGHLLRGGESLEIDPAPEPPGKPLAEDIPLRILHEDDALVAVDKPAGLVVHPAPGSWTGTLVNALLGRGLVAGDSGATAERPGIVHRLDKETSGVLLVARTAEVHRRLSDAFKDRRVDKVYLALVLGRPRPDEGEISWSIGRHPRERKRMSIHSHSPRAARTRYRVLEALGDVSLVEVRPETGRTHQIRVHLAAKGTPVLADPLYGSRKGRARPRAGPAAALERQALHAHEVAFEHPVSGERMTIEAPLPEDLATLVEALREGSR